MGEEGGLKKCKGSVRRIQRMNECRSKEAEEDKYGRRERL